MKNTLFALLFVVALTFAPAVNAETNEEDTLSIIQGLLAQIEVLQEKLNTLRGEVKEVLRDGLKEGMTDEDIAEIQELLATDSDIYPEGLVTGYFGPLTSKALKRFQTRHDLAATGEIDEDTRALLEEYLGEKFGDKIPAGLLRAPGIIKKVKAGMCDDGHKFHKHGVLCKKKNHKDHDEDEDEEHEDEKDKEFDVEVEIEVDGDETTTTVSFTFEDEDYSVEIDETDEGDVLAAVAEELEVEVEDLDKDLEDEIVEELEEALEDEVEDFEIEVEIEIDGDDATTTLSFTFDSTEYEVEVNSTDEDTVLEAVADELGVDVADLDEDLEAAITEELADELAE